MPSATQNAAHVQAAPAPLSASPARAEGSDGLPAEGSDGMPAGDMLICNLHDTPGQVDCSIALNLNVPPISNPNTPGDLLPGLHPSDLQTAYSLPSQNAGGTVAIVDAYDDPNAEADLGVYRTAYNLPSCTTSNGCFRKVNESGQSSSYPLANVLWDQEISLDLDMVSAVCPNCKILLVEATSPSVDDLGKSVDTAAALGAVAISNSWYAAEWSGERSEDVHFRHPGIAITVASGDEPFAYYPASYPYVTGIGGTTLNGGSETHWGPAGYGCSDYEAKPSWQSAANCSTRSTVDIAAVADPQTGVTVYDSTAGGFFVAGGTSVGTPLVAAAYALSGNPRKPSYSYAHANAFHDLPPPGYNLTTGLGSPNGVGGL